MNFFKRKTGPEVRKRLFLFLVSFTIFYRIDAVEATSFTFELAGTPEAKKWGLTGRESLPKDHGMLFLYPRSMEVRVWSLGCLIDLSVAFFDAKGTILEIQPLKAYPDQLDPNRPIRTLSDLQYYMSQPKIITFFLKHSVSPETPINGFLEMEEGWFREHDVTHGDQIIYDLSKGEGVIIKTH